jgi:hypothetical protein
MKVKKIVIKRIYIKFNKKKKLKDEIVKKLILKIILNKTNKNKKIKIKSIG